MLEFWEHHMIPCPFKMMTGYDCPGCGMQRALIELINGNVCISIKFYPALIPLIIMFVFLFIHLKFEVRNGAKMLKLLFIANGSIISISYLIKLFF